MSAADSPLDRKYPALVAVLQFALVFALAYPLLVASLGGLALHYLVSRLAGHETGLVETLGAFARDAPQLVLTGFVMTGWPAVVAGLVVGAVGAVVKRRAWIYLSALVSGAAISVSAIAGPVATAGQFGFLGAGGAIIGVIAAALARRLSGWAPRSR